MVEPIRAHYRYRNLMRDAKITPPYERYGGLFRGGTMPAVCVALYRDNPLGILVMDTLVFAYEDGKMRNILLGTTRDTSHIAISIRSSTDLSAPCGIGRIPRSIATCAGIVSRRLGLRFGADARFRRAQVIVARRCTCSSRGPRGSKPPCELQSVANELSTAVVAPAKIRREIFGSERYSDHCLALLEGCCFA